MSGPVEVPSLDTLIADPAKAATLPPEVAQILLIRMASIHALLIQRALMVAQKGQEECGLLTIKDVAARLKLSTYRAYELARQGGLKSVRLGKSVRVKPEDLAEYLTRQEG